MARKKRAAPARRAADREFRTQIAKLVTTLFQTGFKWGGMGFIAWTVKESIVATAGKVTLADYRFILEECQEFDSFKLVVAAMVFGTLGLWYGRQQRVLRMEVIERMHPYQLRWEESRDTNRTTSALTKKGETPPEE